MIDNPLKKRILNFESILELGFRLIDMLEIVHSTGYVFNDLKLDTIHLGYGQTLDKTGDAS